jgi:hypothetical protein
VIVRSLEETMIWSKQQTSSFLKRTYPVAIIAALAIAGVGWGLSLKPPSAGDKTAAFLSGFDGQSCFLVRSVGERNGAPVIQGVGADKAAFTHFYNAFIRFVGIEPDLMVRLIARSQCAAVDLMQAAEFATADAPRIALESYDASASRPLTGTVSNLAGRPLALLLVGNDGQVRKFDILSQAEGASAVFSIPVLADPASNNTLQVVIAIASAKPLPALGGLEDGVAAEILPRLQRELPAGAVAADFFRYVNTAD